MTKYQKYKLATLSTFGIFFLLIFYNCSQTLEDISSDVREIKIEIDPYHGYPHPPRGPR